MLITLFFLAVAMLVVGFAISKISNVVSTTEGLNSTSTATNVIYQLNLMTSTTINKGFAILFTFLCIGSILTSFLVRVHPAFFFIYIITTGVMVILGAVLGNVYNTLINDTTLIDVASQQTMTNWIMSHIVGIMIAVVAISLIVLFAKVPDEISGGGTVV
jgi:hypothetical protein